MSPDQREAAICRSCALLATAALRRISDLERQLESARRTAEWIVMTGRPEPRLIGHTPEYHLGVYVAGSSLSPELSYNQGPSAWIAGSAAVGPSRDWEADR